LKKVLFGYVILSILLVSGCCGAMVAQPDLKISVTNTDSSWSLDKGLYYKINFYVYNAGDLTTCKNVVAHFKLIDKASSKVRDYQDVYIGTMSSSSSGNYEVTLDGDMGHEYNYECSVTYG
jgi:hypothetical protein